MSIATSPARHPNSRMVDPPPNRVSRQRAPIKQRVRPGVYEHFKGGRYEVIGSAEQVDTDERFVVYRPLYGDRSLVLRSVTEFLEHVDRDGVRKPRFRFIQTPRGSQTLVVKTVYIRLSKWLGRIGKQHS